MLFSWWPLLVAVLLVVVVVRRWRGEPLDLKDAVAAPTILLLLGGREILQIQPTTVDIIWLVVLAVVGLLFGAARSASTIIEWRGGRLIQRYRGRTFALLLASLVVGGALGLLAQQLGMHPQARPMPFTIGIGLAGEAVITLLRAARRGVPMPWSERLSALTLRYRDAANGPLLHRVRR